MTFSRQVFQGKTIGRILFNECVEQHCALMSGRVIDLGGGNEASYYQFLPKSLNVTRTNIEGVKGTDTVIDLNQPLPYKDAIYDAALLFNVIYILENPVETLREIKRILKPGGRLYIASPFTANEMPEPHDYVRFTSEGLQKILRKAGWSEFSITRYGERFTSAAYILHPFFVWNIARLVVYKIARALDNAIPSKIKSEHPHPIGYFVVAKNS